MRKLLMRIGACGIALICLGCGKEYEEVQITMFDYRFIPDRVSVSAGNPVRMFIRNQGRETHRFQSSILKNLEVNGLEGRQRNKNDMMRGIPVHPGKTIQVFLILREGQYVFHCPIRGHRGMNGVLLVKERT